MRSCHLFVLHVLCILLFLYNRPNNIGWLIRKFVLILPLSSVSSCTCFLAGEEAYCGKLLSVRTEILLRINRQAFLWFCMEYLNKVLYFAKSDCFFVNQEQSSVITMLTSRYIRSHAIMQPIVLRDTVLKIEIYLTVFEIVPVHVGKLCKFWCIQVQLSLLFLP